jgi:dephospho-CoA kinase
MSFCVGLTGGIGCGKSKATEMFAALGAGIVDTDEISRELTAAGGRAVPALESAFGAQYITAEGALDRARMRTLVFSDATAKGKLEAILHPLIRTESRARIAAATAPYTIVVVPLLLETGAYADLIDRVLVVDCDEDQQVARTMARSNLSESDVRAIMAAQLPRRDRLARADDVLRNDSDINALRLQVETLHRRYLDEVRAKG